MVNIWDGIQHTARQVEAAPETRKIMRVLGIVERSHALSTALTGVISKAEGTDWEDVAAAVASVMESAMVALASVVQDPEAFFAEYLRPHHPDGPWTWPDFTSSPMADTAPDEVAGPGTIHVWRLGKELGVGWNLIMSTVNRVAQQIGLNHTIVNPDPLDVNGFHDRSILTVRAADIIRAKLGPSELMTPTPLQQTVTTPDGTLPVRPVVTASFLQPVADGVTAARSVQATQDGTLPVVQAGMPPVGRTTEPPSFLTSPMGPEAFTSPRQEKIVAALRSTTPPAPGTVPAVMPLAAGLAEAHPTDTADGA